MKLYIFDVDFIFEPPATLAGDKQTFSVLSITNDAAVIYSHFREVLKGRIIKCVLKTEIDFDKRPTFITTRVGER